VAEVASFSIAFTGFDDEDPLVAFGELRLGEHSERFQSVLGFWEPVDYQASWAAGLARLLGGASVSCLATSVLDPAAANFIEVWPLYRQDEHVYVQNHLLFLDQLPRNFDPAAPWDSVRPRSVMNEEGRAISEWQVTVEEVTEFLESRRQG
jgi:hypothetical protein